MGCLWGEGGCVVGMGEGAAPVPSGPHVLSPPQRSGQAGCPSPGPAESWAGGCCGDARCSRLRWPAPGKQVLTSAPQVNVAPAPGGRGGEASRSFVQTSLKTSCLGFSPSLYSVPPDLMSLTKENS